MSTSSLWLCLHFPALPVDVFCRDRDFLPAIDKPVVVLERQRVVAMNQRAEDIDIRIGSSMGTAWAVSEQIISFERNEPKELAALNRLAQWAYQFTPSVCIQHPDSLLLEISGCLKLFKGLPALKQRILSGLDELGFHCTSGVNVTPLAALYTAKSGLKDNTEASRVKQSLRRLPVSSLEVDAKTRTSLQQMGIVDLEQLLRLPGDGLSRRFSVFFSDYLARLTGDRPDPRSYISSKPQFFSELTFLADVTNMQSLVFPLKRLLNELEAFLRARQLLVNRFTVTLAHRSHGRREIPVYLADPDNDTQLFLALAQLRLDAISDMPEVDSLSLTANTFFELIEEEAQGGDLFQSSHYQSQDGSIHSKADAAKQTRLLNMLTARLGRESCFGLTLADDHRPEKAWQTTRPAEKNRWREIEKDINPRPAYLLPHAKPLTVVDDTPCLSGPLELLQGPERIDFGWWEAGLSSPARDYYIARNHHGALYWIYATTLAPADTKDWYLHGIFS